MTIGTKQRKYKLKTNPVLKLKLKCKSCKSKATLFSIGKPYCRACYTKKINSGEIKK